MKFLSVILVVMVMGLSMAPCCTPVVKEIAGSVSQAEGGADCCTPGKKDPGDQESQDDPCGVCSPFYTCGTCTGFTFHELKFYIPRPGVILETSYISLDVRFDSEYFNSKWQPPKIS
jgi:hypothetical protein